MPSMSNLCIQNSATVQTFMAKLDLKIKQKNNSLAVSVNYTRSVQTYCIIYLGSTKPEICNYHTNYFKIYHMILCHVGHA